MEETEKEIDKVKQLHKQLHQKGYLNDEESSAYVVSLDGYTYVLCVIAQMYTNIHKFLQNHESCDHEIVHAYIIPFLGICNL
jgi:hypothetical protein